MSNFIEIQSKIISKNIIDQVVIERDISPRPDWDYPNGERTTNIYVVVTTNQNEKIEAKYNDDQFWDFIDFVRDFFNLEGWEPARSKAINLINKAYIRDRAD